MVVDQLMKNPGERSVGANIVPLSFASGSKSTVPCGSQTGSYRFAQNNIGTATNVNDLKTIGTLRRTPAVRHAAAASLKIEH
jgi:hypothetical protein